MISREIIKTLADKYQTTELNVKREYFQHIFLSYFYRQPRTDSIYFKGGSALRIFYQSPRFSEDLDFSSDLKSQSGIKKILLQTLPEIEREGTIIRLKEAKVTSGGYLAKIAFTEDKQPIEILLQISLRQNNLQGQIVTVVNNFIPAYTVVGLAQDQLVTEKVQALLIRQKPRDFYDFYFLLRANLLSYPQRKALKEVLKILQNTQLNFEVELKQFLPKSHWPLIRDFKAVLQREIQRFV